MIIDPNGHPGRGAAIAPPANIWQVSDPPENGRHVMVAVPAGRSVSGALANRTSAVKGDGDVERHAPHLDALARGAPQRSRRLVEERSEAHTPVAAVARRAPTRLKGRLPGRSGRLAGATAPSLEHDRPHGHPR